MLRVLVAAACASQVACAGAQSAPAPRTEAPVERVIVVSIDGLMPETYTDPDRVGLKVPTLRQLRAEGAWSPGAMSVIPSVTYPAHTSMATGMRPAGHGITTNLAWDPAGGNHEGWRWYAEDIHATTLWDAVGKAGGRAALVNWPVSVGAHVDAVLPEYWRAGTSDDVKLVRALATPGLIDGTQARFPGFLDRYHPPDIQDAAFVDAAIHILETRQPRLLMVHLWNVDDAQHEHGPGSTEARAAVERADAEVQRLIAAAKRTGNWQHTALVVVSDHGFASIKRKVRPGVLLARAGLVDAGADGKLRSWRAVVSCSGGLAYVYGADGDVAAAPAARQALQAGIADGWLAAVLEPEQIVAAGGDPDAAFALVGGPDVGFTDGYLGEPVEAAPPGAATHGWPPDRPEMAASLLVWGPPVHGGQLRVARLIDIAPTVAAWLRLDLGPVDGRPLDIEVNDGP